MKLVLLISRQGEVPPDGMLVELKLRVALPRCAQFVQPVLPLAKPPLVTRSLHPADVGVGVLVGVFVGAGVEVGPPVISVTVTSSAQMRQFGEAVVWVPSIQNEVLAEEAVNVTSAVRQVSWIA